MVRNNKGFMLVEVIVTSTVVITAMIAFYTSFNKLYNVYRTKNTYYNLDGIYASKKMINELVKYDINKFINNAFYTKEYEYLVAGGTCLEGLSSNCVTIKDLYGIENMIFVEYDSVSINKLKGESGINQSFVDYIDYLIGYYNIGVETTEYNYIVLTELRNEDSYYYANLRMR